MAGTYSTPRVDLAAYLLCKNYGLVNSVEKNGKVWFEFAVDGRDIAPDIADFFSGQHDSVSASAYNAATWKLSHIIRDIKHENGNRR